MVHVARWPSGFVKRTLTCCQIPKCKGRDGARAKHLMRAVRALMFVTTAACQRTGSRGLIIASVICIPLLAPGVPVDVVAPQLPESRFFPLGELQLVQPFGRFPEVEVRH
jgi:hypothetical protein